MRNRITIALASLLALVGIAGLTSSSAQAGPDDGPYRGGTYFVDNTLGQADMYTGTWDYLLKTNAPNSVWTTTLNNNVVTPEKLSPALRAKVNAAGQNVTADIERQTIENIGGSFATRATGLGSFELPAGTWMVTTSATFYRTATGVEGTRPQMALRYNDLAGDAGTILGQEISETANRELMQSITKRVTVAAPTSIDVYGFGYNDNTSAAGGGQIDADAQITAVRIGG